ncbi:MAG: hypothetical protein KA314_22125 [Chloroflexi bacterium]|nr:hypothetical protein [Chloroflexota bacterium]MBP8058540.1 hypothetical protein [Chloroflexota bacterium]
MMFHPIKHVRFLIGLTVLACWLVACQSTPREAGVTVTLEPTAAAFTPTPIPPTPLPTATPLPSATPLPPDPTATPFVEATPTNVPTATAPVVDVFYELESLSPDGQWRAHSLLTFVGEEGNVTGYQTDLTVSQAEGDISWVAYTTLQGAGLGYEVPTVLAWSEDGQSLFFTMQAIPDGCPGYLTRYYSGLYHLDLTSGEVVTLEFAGIPSPDGTMVAQMTWEPAAAILIHHLNDNSTTTYPLETTLDQTDPSLKLTWSPDSQAVALENATANCITADNYLLLYLDVVTGEQRVLIQQDGVAWAIVEWSTPDEIYLRVAPQETPVEVINVETGERTPLE